MTGSIESSGRAASHKVAAWVPPVARVGYAAKGVVYGLVGWIAVKAATASGGAKGTSEALASLTSKHGGQIMLLLIAVGLFAHVAWRVVQALLDPEHQHTGGKRTAMRLFYGLSAVIYFSLAVTAWQLSQGHGGGSGNSQQIWVGKLLSKPFGTWLVMLTGIGVMAYGLQQLVKAARGDVNKRMGASDATMSRGLRIVGRIGTAARGVVLLPIGWFVFQAGRQYHAATAADTGQVLQMLGHHGLLAAVGLGLMAYGLHQLGKAVYRRIERPA